MVALVAGNSLGLNLTSLATLGARGTPGNAGIGRGTDRAYVNVSNGNLVIQNRDDALAGPGLWIDSLRTYNSQEHLGGDFRLPGLQPPRLTSTGGIGKSNSSVVRKDADGGEDLYTFDAYRAAYLSTDGAGAYDTIRYINNQLVWTDGDTGLTEYYARYQNEWQLVLRQDSDGNAISFLYNKDGQVQSAINRSGEGVYYDYSTRLLAQVRTVTIDANGNAQTVRVRYGYDSFRRLASVTVDLSPENGSTADGRVYVTRYDYDGPSDRITAVRESDGSSLAIAYVGAGNDIRVASVTNALGETLRFAYDTANRRTTVTDALGLVTRYDYDALGQLTRITGPVINGSSQVQSFVYNARGDVLQITDAKGQVTAMEYDANGNQVLQRAAAGNVVARSYDGQNQLQTETVYLVPDPDGAGAGRASVPQTTHYIHDAGQRNQLRFVVSAEGRVTEYRYNSTGQRIVELHYAAAYRDTAGWPIAYPQQLPATPLGMGAAVSGGGYTGTAPTEALLAAWAAAQDPGQVVRVDNRYDFRGQLQQQLRYPVLPSDGSANVATSTGSNPNLITSTVGNGNSVGNGNGNGNANGKGNGNGNGNGNGVGNGVGVGNGNGGVGNGAGNGVGNNKPLAPADITQYVYDPFGRLLQVITPNGGATSYAYDGLNRVLTARDAYGTLTVTSYDDAGDRTTVQSANGLRSVSSFDRAGRLVSLMQTDATGQALSTTTYDYDADGRLRHRTDPTGVEHWMLFDDASRLVAEIDGNRSLVEYVYDRNNQVVQTIRYATPVSGTLPAILPSTALAGLRPVARPDDVRAWRLFDAANRLVAEVDAEGGVVRNEYDGAGRITRTTAYATSIDVSRLSAEPTLAAVLPPPSTDDRITRRFYDNDGLLRAMLDGEGSLQEWRYDAAGQQVASIRYATATNAALRSTGTLAQLRPASSNADSLTNWIYNARGQVTAEIDGENYLTSYRYDGDGNRISTIRHARALTDVQRAALIAGGIASSWRPVPSSADGVQTQSYDLLDRLVASTDISGTVTRYDYDAMSRLVKTTMAAGSVEERMQTRRYDLQGRLLAELSGEGNAALAKLVNPTTAQVEAIWQQHAMRYQYDAAGRLLSRTDANGNRNVFYYDADDQLLYAVNAAGEVQAHQYDAHGRELVLTRYATRLSTTQLATLQGGLINGNRNADIPSLMASLTNASADSSTRYRYDRTGRVIEVTDALGQRITQRYDAFGELVGKTLIAAENGDINEAMRYDRRSLLLSDVRDARGLQAQTRAEYDAFGRAIRTIDPNGNVREQRYDRLGRTVQSIDGTGALFATGYDALSRVISRTDALGNTTTIAYDNAARSSTVTTPEGVVVTTVLNRHGQTQSVTDGNGNTTTYTYDRNGNLTTTATPLAQTGKRYDAGNRLIESIDGNGVSTVLSYDAADRVLSRIVDPDGLALKTSYVYDALGRVIRSTDANGVDTTYRYDTLGQLLEQVVDPAGLALSTRYSWNSRGQQLSVVDPNGTTTRYSYDNLGRRSSETVDPDGLALTTRYAYDANGNVVARTDGVDWHGGIVRWRTGWRGRRRRQRCGGLCFGRGWRCGRLHRQPGASCGAGHSIGTTAVQLWDWATYTTPDAAQRTAEIQARYGNDPRFAQIDQMRESPLGAIGWLGARVSGASPAAQQMWLDIGTSADGLAMSGAALAGRAPAYTGARTMPELAGEPKPFEQYNRTRLNIEQEMFRTPNDELSVVISRNTGNEVTRQLVPGTGGTLTPEVQRSMSGNTFTHFHPNGGNFSPADILTGLANGAAEIRAVTGERTISMNFERAPEGLLGNPANAYEFMKNEGRPINFAVNAATQAGTLSSTNAIERSDYRIKVFLERNPWVTYTETKTKH